MSNKSMDKIDVRKATIAFSIVAMLVVSFGVNNVDAAASPVSLSTDITSSDIMVGQEIVVPIKLTSSDNTFRQMEVKLSAYFKSGISWTTQFRTTSGSILNGDLVSLGKQDSTEINLWIFCDGVCSAGDTNTVSVRGQSDPKWYDSGTDSGTTEDCQPSCTDTTPASASSNVTNELNIALTARTGGSHTVACDAASSQGDDLMFQGVTYQWDYDLVNTGWEDDTYTFAVAVTSPTGATVSDWTLSAGLSNKVLTGQKDTSDSAVHSAEASMDITPSTIARPGVYNVGLQVTGTNSGNVEGCEFNVIIAEPDLEVKDTDIEFSHSSAWINSRGDSQRVTIYATIRNNGGTVDTEGAIVENVDVIFLVDGSQLGSVQTISSLGYGEEVTLSAFWNPGRAHDSDEVGIPIKVSVDPSVDIQESDADNNIGSSHFKVVKTKASNPSFYMSFLSLVGAVGAAVLMSTYYRNKDSEE